jgi:diguanylate cyclase (GGDEF)-like protein
VEDPRELAVLRDIGYHCAQGYFIGRPVSEPTAIVADNVIEVLQSRKLIVLPSAAAKVDKQTTVRKLLRTTQAVVPTTSNQTLLELLLARPDTPSIAVVENGVPLGLINRRHFMDRYAQPYHKELFGRRPCTMFMHGKPLVVDIATPIDSLASVLTGNTQYLLHDGFIITDSGKYVGMSTGESLVKAVMERRVEAARHANPLTFLPGNIPVTEHIRRLLQSRRRFTAAYFDLNNFKPFNDVYGYWRGDEMIKLCANVIVGNCMPEYDFVGHIGGDDFMVIFQSDDWEECCKTIVCEFNNKASALFDEEHIALGGIAAEDRQGYPAFFSITSISVGVVVIDECENHSPESVASAAASAKKHAKAAGSGLHIVRQRAITEIGG